MAVPIYIPTKSAHTILFSTTLLTFVVFLLTVILTGIKQHLTVVLIFISLMISDAEYLSCISWPFVCLTRKIFKIFIIFKSDCVWVLFLDVELHGGFLDGLEGKESDCNVRYAGLIPGSGISPGGGSGNPIQYSCLKNPMDRGTWSITVQRVAKSQTWLTMHTYVHWILWISYIFWIVIPYQIDALGWFTNIFSFHSLSFYFAVSFCCGEIC